MIKLIKIRIEGTLQEIIKASKLLSQNKKMEMLSKSEPYKNRGNNCFYRIYIDADLRESDYNE